MSIRRTRLSSADSRAAALEAARAILIERGPQAVTLKAVAARIGRTHANLSHHFGSAEGLQRALATAMTGEIGRSMADRVAEATAREGTPNPQLVVDLFFDAFRNDGGALAAWLSLTADPLQLAPVFAEARPLIEQSSVLAGEPARIAAYLLMLLALGDALMGAPLATALDLPRETARRLAAERLAAVLAAREGDGEGASG